MGLPSSVRADRSGTLQSFEVCELFAQAADGGGSDGEDIDNCTAFGCSIQAVISAESFTGAVFGMAQTEVNPPAAAACVPLAMSPYGIAQARAGERACR